MQIKLKWWLISACLYLFCVALLMQYPIYPIWQIFIFPTTLAIKIVGTTIPVLTMVINLLIVALIGATINFTINKIAHKKETSAIQAEPVPVTPGQNM